MAGGGSDAAAPSVQHRQAVADDPFRQQVGSDRVGVHSRAQRDLRFHFSLLAAGTNKVIAADFQALKDACRATP